MGFRTVIIDSHAKVEYSLNYLVFRTPEETKRVLIDEIHTVIFQSTAVAVTTSLLAELISHKIKVIFCDEKKNPSSELLPYYGCHNSSKRIKDQLSWDEINKGKVWKVIIERKILNQAMFLDSIGKSDKGDQLREYARNVFEHDSTNREGHAAKVYFNNVFYEGFTRSDDNPINDYLNYGYTIILSQFNRIIVSSGFLTQIGIHHKNDFNEFNLSSDFMEPFRFLIDDEAKEIKESDNFKEKMVAVLAKEVKIDGKEQTVVNAINIYVSSLFIALSTGDISKIRFIEGYASK